MAQVRPMLDDIELQQVQHIDVDGDQVLVRHDVPGLEGDFLQRLNRRAGVIRLAGVLTGATAKDDLKTLRDKFRAGAPLDFVADITTATQVDQVMIEDLSTKELAGKPERFEYALILREFIPPPRVEEEQPPEIKTPEDPAERIDEEVGTLVVEVNVEGQPGFDFSQVNVTVRGTSEDGAPFSQTLTNRTDNVWTAENMPAGEYTVEAIVTEPGVAL
jgi:hypothetical protein